MDNPLFRKRASPRDPTEPFPFRSVFPSEFPLGKVPFQRNPISRFPESVFPISRKFDFPISRKTDSDSRIHGKFNFPLDLWLPHLYFLSTGIIFLMSFFPPKNTPNLKCIQSFDEKIFHLAYPTVTTEICLISCYIRVTSE